MSPDHAAVPVVFDLTPAAHGHEQELHSHAALHNVAQGVSG